MPIAEVPLSDPDPAKAVQAKVAELEAGNAKITDLKLVGDQWLIFYENKPRVGRPPRIDTRGDQPMDPPS